MSTARRGALVIAAIVACACVLPALARPRVCLVLSGGGARGAAHIGVLKVLEEMRIPVDCIAATSMGSIVGGAYATGMPLADMEREVGAITTNRLFVERPPRDDLSLRRKLDDRTVLFGVEVGVRGGEVLLPKGIVSGVQLEGVLRGLVRQQGHRRFDDLAVPFRAVATDLENGRPVVIAEGEVAQAMRASMSVPGAVAPAEFAGYLLVDGGLTDNLPVGVARGMGAEVVIAVNLGTPLLKRTQLGSVLGVAGQMINILTEQNVQASLASLGPGDVLIEPLLGDFSAGDFDNLLVTIPIGEAATRKVAARLEKLAVPEAEYRAWRAARERPVEKPPRIDEVRFAGLNRVNPDVPRHWMVTQEGAALDPVVIDRDVRNLFGTGDFEHVGYSVLADRDRRVLMVDAIEKSWGPDYVRMGLGLGSDFKGDSFFSAAASYRRTWINSLGAEWRTDLEVGSTSRLVSELYQPLFTSRALFVAPRVEVQRRGQDLYQGDARVARYDVRDSLLALDVGSEFGRYGEVRLGLLGGFVSASQQTGPPALAPPEGRRQRGAATATLVFDRLDSANFPRSGFATRLSILDASRALGADDRYARYDAVATVAMPFEPHGLQLSVRSAGNMGSDPLPAYDQVVWGGFLQQSGYARGSLTGQRLSFARAVYTYRLTNQRLLEGLYAGASLEAGRLDKPLVPGGISGSLRSAAAFLGLDTPIGPLYVGLGVNGDGGKSAYFYLGRP